MISNSTKMAVLLVISVCYTVPAATEQKPVPPSIGRFSEVTSSRNLVCSTEEAVISWAAAHNCSGSIEAHVEGAIPLGPIIELHGSNGLNPAMSMFQASGCLHLSPIASATAAVWSNKLIHEMTFKEFRSNSNWNVESNSDFNFLFDSLSSEWIEFAARHGVLVLPYKPTGYPMLGGSAHTFAPAFACADTSGRTLGFDFATIAGLWRKRRYYSQRR